MIKCIYPNGQELSKSDIMSFKEFGVIVKNYLKINRLYETFSKKNN